MPITNLGTDSIINRVADTEIDPTIDPIGPMFTPMGYNISDIDELSSMHSLNSDMSNRTFQAFQELQGKYEQAVAYKEKLIPGLQKYKRHFVRLFSKYCPEEAKTFI
jgi:hypothetical protein